MKTLLLDAIGPVMALLQHEPLAGDIWINDLIRTFEPPSSTMGGGQIRLVRQTGGGWLAVVRVDANSSSERVLRRAIRCLVDRDLRRLTGDGHAIPGATTSAGRSR